MNTDVLCVQWDVHACAAATAQAAAPPAANTVSRLTALSGSLCFTGAIGVVGRVVAALRHWAVDVSAGWGSDAERRNPGSHANSSSA
ncbi:MAG TPA: hypothetical protein PJ982_01080, partial [Lacipirellulaceae bacterium]|nr:hypothetical protein [Lacipirellulaceae bacterium]